MSYEVAIALENLPDDAGGERKKEGDIIVCRPTGTGIGSVETNRYLWFRVEGLSTREDYDELAGMVAEPDPGGTIYDKRRYCVPLDRLEVVDTSFDKARARDPADFYQPYMLVDEETLEYVTTDPPFQVQGLVFDKVVGDYI